MEGSDFDALFEEVLRLMQGMTANQAPRQVVQTADSARDELIEGRDRLTYIINAPGYEKDDLRVSVLDDEIEVKGPDFIARKRLPVRVNPDGAKSAYNNGVLSVTVERVK